MKAVILAGGLGTRISEETMVRPKPMVEIGDMPIVWHIMKHLSHYGIKEFIICAGYKSSLIRDFFLNFRFYHSDIQIDCKKGNVQFLTQALEEWKVTIVDSGIDTSTGGRLLSVKEYIKDEDFLMTYGDGLSNVNIYKLMEEHQKRETLATVTAVKPKGRYGHLFVQGGKVESFHEKDADAESWINGGYFILNPQCLDFIEDSNTHWEQGPMQKLAASQQLSAFMHSGFWQSMDTLREKLYLEELWNSGNAPWKVW